MNGKLHYKIVLTGSTATPQRMVVPGAVILAVEIVCGRDVAVHIEPNVQRLVYRLFSRLYVMIYAVPTLCNMPQHTRRIHNVCNAKSPRLHRRGPGGWHTKVFGKVK